MKNLSIEHEYNIFNDINNPKNVNVLYKSHENLMKSYSYKFSKKFKVDFEEAFSLCNIAFTEALYNFDTSKNVRFVTFLHWKILAQFKEYRIKHLSKINNEVSNIVTRNGDDYDLFDSLQDSKSSQYNELYDRERISIILDKLKKYPDRSVDIVLSKTISDGIDKKLAKIYNVSNQRVNYIYHETISKLKKECRNVV
jgi:RNA polymerase sigma factor (sigma-70 family)